MARIEVTENELKNELAAALLADACIETRQPHDVDMYQMRDLDPLGRSEKWWKSYLDGKVSAGELVRLIVWNGRRNVTIYRRAVKDSNG